MKALFFIVALLSSVIISQAGLLDPSSFANVEEVVQRNITWKAVIDFDNQIISGFSEIAFELLTPPIRFIIVDIKNMHIENVTLNGTVLRSIYNASAINNTLGTPLTIDLGRFYLNQTILMVRICYTTFRESPIFHWVGPQYSTEGKYPFMYTNCKAANCRSLLPCQDTPSAKFIYNAKLSVKAPMKVVSVGEYYNNLRDGDYLCYQYRSANNIPSYSISVAAGDFGMKEMGKRVALWTETVMLDYLSPLFEKSERILNNIEDYLTPYQWKFQYFLAMPKSYAFRQRECPNLLLWPNWQETNGTLPFSDVLNSFSYSWFGSLVTHLNWQNTWLSEGLSTFIERKILKRALGEDLYNVSAYRGIKKMNDFIKTKGENHTLTSLFPLLDNNTDPNIAINIVAKEKGFLFIHHLESIVGEAVLQKVLQNFILLYKNQSANYIQFKDIFEITVSQIYSGPKLESLLRAVDWNSWVLTPGYPPVKYEFTSVLINNAKSLADSFLNRFLSILYSNNLPAFKSWDQSVQLLFLSILHERELLITDTIYRNIRDSVKPLEIDNPKVRFSWLYLALKLRQKDITPVLEDFLSSYGRYHYVVRLYKEYYQMDKISALRSFSKNKGFYHPAIVRELSKFFIHMEMKN